MDPDRLPSPLRPDPSTPSDHSCLAAAPGNGAGHVNSQFFFPFIWVISPSRHWLPLPGVLSFYPAEDAISSHASPLHRGSLCSRRYQPGRWAINGSSGRQGGERLSSRATWMELFRRCPIPSSTCLEANPDGWLSKEQNGPRPRPMSESGDHCGHIGDSSAAQRRWRI